MGRYCDQKVGGLIPSRACLLSLHATENKVHEPRRLVHFLPHETRDALNSIALDFFPVLASDSYESGDSLGTLFLFQRISVILQRFNAVSIDKSFLDADEEPDL